MGAFFLCVCVCVFMCVFLIYLIEIVGFGDSGINFRKKMIEVGQGLNFPLDR